MERDHEIKLLLPLKIQGGIFPYCFYNLNKLHFNLLYVTNSFNAKGNVSHIVFSSNNHQAVLFGYNQIKLETLFY